MKQTVFISRFLTEDKITSYSKLCGFNIIAKSLIDFKAEPKKLLPKADILFFYSKKGIEFFTEIYGNEALKDYKLACLGTATQKLIIERGFETVFCGNGEPEMSKRAFNAFAKSKHVLFARAQNSREYFEKGTLSYKVSNLIVYRNTIKKDIDIPQADIFLFTSPLNVEAYLFNGGSKNANSVAIGRTTYNTLQKNSFRSIHQSETSSEKSIILKAKQLLEKTK
jgi:uroporphyrinogen-III synthase